MQIGEPYALDAWDALGAEEREAASAGLDRFFALIAERSVDAATRLLVGDPHVGVALAVRYRLPVQDGRLLVSFDDATVMSVGHRTLLLRLHNAPTDPLTPPRPLVVKLTRPEHCDDPEALAELARERQMTVARLLAAGERFLIFDVAPGRVLVDWLTRKRWLPGPDGDALDDTEARGDAAAALGVALCRALADLHAATGEAHGNLTLSSVMVDDSDDTLAVHLLDAGVEERAPDHVEPTDPPAGHRGDATAADVYAVGAILLQVLTRKPLVHDDLREPLADAWARFPGLARVIEDLIDPTPSQRMVMLDVDPGESEWDALAAIITGEHDLFRLFRPSADILDGGRSEASISTWSQVRRYFRAADRIKLSKDDAWGAGYDLLKYINLLSYALWVTCLTGFVVLTSADIGLNTPSDDVQDVLQRVTNFRVGAFDDNFPGRFLALSFSYIALAYYSRILASVTVRRLGVPLIEATIRSVPVVYQLPAVYTIYYDPSIWPLAATLGILATAVTAAFLRNLDLRALHAMDASLGYPPRSVDAAIKQRRHYSSWGRTATFYLALLVGFDFLLYRYDVLQDGWFYALVLAIGANYYVIYWVSIRKLGASVHGSLQQTTFVLRRAARVDARRTGTAVPSTFEKSAFAGGVLIFGPAVAVLSVALGLLHADDRTPEIVLGALGGAALVVGELLRRTSDASARNTPRRLATTALLAIGAWLVVVVGGRFLFDAGWLRAITALLGAAGAAMLADWALQVPGLSRSQTGDGDADQRTKDDWAALLTPTNLRTRAGRRLIALAALGRPTATQLETAVQGAWTRSPRNGRALERMVTADPRLALPDTADTDIATATHDIVDERDYDVWHWSDLSPTRRAQCSLPAPAATLNRPARVGLAVSNVLSWTIAAVCTAGFLYYLITDPDWQRSPERFLALTYNIGAVAYQQVLIGWITVAHLRRWGTELALRAVPLVFQGPAVFAIFRWPDLWPAWATIGMGSTTVVNWLLLRIVKQSLEAVAPPGAQGREQVKAELATRNFGQWWLTAGAYTLLLIAFDLLITVFGVLHDSGFFAFCLGVGANLYVIVHSSLGEHGTEVRGQILRAVMTLALVPQPEARPAPVADAAARDPARVGDLGRRAVLAVNVAPLACLCAILALQTPTHATAVAVAGGALALLSAVLLWASLKTTPDHLDRARVLDLTGLAGLTWGVALLAAAASVALDAPTVAVALSPLAGLVVGLAASATAPRNAALRAHRARV